MQKIKGLIIPTLLLALWIAIGDRFPPMILPSFTDTMLTLRELFQNGEMGAAWRGSMFRIVYATALSAIISIVLGLLSRSFTAAREVIMPFTNFIRYIPVTVFYPLLIIWLGIDEEMRIAFLFIATFFAFFPSVMLTLDSISPSLIEKALTAGASKFKMMIYVYIPAALPSLCRSFLAMVSIGFTYMIIAETTNVRYGLGYLMIIGSARGRTSIVFAAIIVTILTGVAIDVSGNFLIRKVFKWDENARN